MSPNSSSSEVGQRRSYSSIRRSASSRGGAHGQSGAHVPRNWPSQMTSACTRSGYVAAKTSARSDASPDVKIAARCEPAASKTTRQSSIRTSTGGAPTTRSERPVPRLSKTISRYSAASASSQARR